MNVYKMILIVEFIGAEGRGVSHRIRGYIMVLVPSLLLARRGSWWCCLCVEIVPEQPIYRHDRRLSLPLVMLAISKTDMKG